MTEAIKTYPKNIENHMKTIDNCLWFSPSAEVEEKTKGFEPIVSRYDEQGNIRIIVADSEVRSIWNGMRKGAASEMIGAGFEQEVIEITNRERA